MLSDVMRELPTFEIRADTTNSVADVVMRNGAVSGDRIDDIAMFTTSGDPNMTLSSPSGTLELVDAMNFVYRLDLDSARLMLTEADITRSILAEAEDASVYLDFSSQLPSLTDSSPSNLSSAELWPLMQSRRQIRDENVRSFHIQREEELYTLASALRNISDEDSLSLWSNIIDNSLSRLDALGEDEPVQFYYQYYSAEFNKKFALSLGCLALTVMTLPLSLIKIRHGRLVGFGLSLLIAVSYWYILFVSQLKIFDYSFNAGFLMYIPDAVMLIAGLVLLAWRTWRAG